MQIAADFTAAEAAFTEALQRGDAQIEIVLAAGAYNVRDLTLEDETMTVAVTLRGEGDVTLDGVGVTIVAGSASVSGLRFQGRHLLPFAQLEVRDAATVRSLHFVNAATRHPRGAPPLVDLVAAGPAAVASVSGWTVEHSNLPLLALRVQPGGRFASADITDIAAHSALGSAPAISAKPVDALSIARISLPDGADVQ